MLIAHILISSCLPDSLETLDLFDNQLDEVDNQLTGLPLLARLDIGGNNLSSAVINSLGSRFSYFWPIYCTHSCRGLYCFLKLSFYNG